MASKQNGDSNQDLHDTLSEVFELHISNNTAILKGTVQHEVKTSTNIVLSAMKETVRNQAEEYRNDMDLFIDSHNAVVNTVNNLSETQIELTHSVLEQNKKNIDRAERNEHTSYQLRGQIDRLRNELGVMKRQSRDKDQMVKELSERVALVADQNVVLMGEMKELSTQNATLMDLMKTLLARQ